MAYQENEVAMMETNASGWKSRDREDVTVRATQVEREFSDTEKAVAEMNDTLQGLASRLTAVLREEPIPDRSAKQAEGVPMLVPMADRTRHLRNQIEGATSRIRDLIERLEV